MINFLYLVDKEWGTSEISSGTGAENVSTISTINGTNWKKKNDNVNTIITQFPQNLTTIIKYFIIFNKNKRQIKLSEKELLTRVTKMY